MHTASEGPRLRNRVIQLCYRGRRIEDCVKTTGDKHFAAYSYRSVKEVRTVHETSGSPCPRIWIVQFREPAGDEFMMLSADAFTPGDQNQTVSQQGRTVSCTNVKHAAGEAPCAHSWVVQLR